MKTIPIFVDKYNLPKHIDHLVLDDIEIYEQKVLGVKIRYHADNSSYGGAKADIYLYDAGRSPLPQNIRSPDMLKLFQAAYSEIRVAAQLDIYENLEEMNAEFLHLPENAPEPMWLWAAFRYRQPPGRGSVTYTLDRVSHLALRTDRGYVNKVRYTYPGYIEEQEFSHYLQFLFEWQQIVGSFQLQGPRQNASTSQRRSDQATFHHHLPKIPGSQQPRPPQFFHLPALMEKQRQEASEMHPGGSLIDPLQDRNSHVHAVEGLHHEIAHAIYSILEKEMALSIDIAGFPHSIDMRQHEQTGEESDNK
jgi:hypothetical protein